MGFLTTVSPPGRRREANASAVQKEGLGWFRSCLEMQIGNHPHPLLELSIAFRCGDRRKEHSAVSSKVLADHIAYALGIIDHILIVETQCAYAQIFQVRITPLIVHGRCWVIVT
jgi:hypothetical protein